MLVSFFSMLMVLVDFTGRVFGDNGDVVRIGATLAAMIDEDPYTRSYVGLGRRRVRAIFISNWPFSSVPLVAGDWYSDHRE